MADRQPVLVVDDEFDLREIIADALDLHGYPVATAADGAAALEVVERERPSLILLDMRMPVLDGWGFARELRARGIDIPIVVITAAQDASRWAREIGAVGYVAKPFSMDELLSAVERVHRG